MTLQVGFVVKVYIATSDVFHKVWFFFRLNGLSLDLNRTSRLLVLATCCSSFLELFQGIWILDHHCAPIIVNFYILTHLLAFFIRSDISFNIVYSYVGGTPTLARLRPIFIVTCSKLLDVLHRSHH